jgi:hypothetical protein
MVLLTMRAYMGVILGWKLLWTILTSKFRFESERKTWWVILS